MTLGERKIGHYQLLIESAVDPMHSFVEGLSTDPQQLRATRADYEAMIGRLYAGNVVHHDYLPTRARAC